MISFGVDVGGSGAKGAPVDLDTGKLLAKRFRLRTPRPATPGSVIETIRSIVEHHAWRGPVGVTIPGVVVHGVVR
ncbi:MAG: ROK family protein, partial [Actinomycetota bacterium]|nr:ROK family protein [Actinomycetota bacterium]